MDTQIDSSTHTDLMMEYPNQCMQICPYNGYAGDW